MFFYLPSTSPVLEWSVPRRQGQVLFLLQVVNRCTQSNHVRIIAVPSVPRHLQHRKRRERGKQKLRLSCDIRTLHQIYLLAAILELALATWVELDDPLDRRLPRRVRLPVMRAVQELLRRILRE